MDIAAYLASLPRQSLARLYQNPASCLAIFRLLPSLAKHFLLSILLVPGDISIETFHQWIKPSSRKHQVEALEILGQLHIIELNNKFYSLHNDFRNGFLRALTGSTDDFSFGISISPKDSTDIQFLERWSSDRWESILHFMVGNSLQNRPGPGVLHLLREGGLMEVKNGDSLCITRVGFQFLLQDRNTQIWSFLLHYLHMAQELLMDTVEMLHFIFMLGTFELGLAYSFEGLSPTQRQMTSELGQYGLIYRPSPESEYFYPTKLAISLTVDSVKPKTGKESVLSSIEQASSEEGFIILETNYRVYAYTDSPLQISILNLFCGLKARFSNMIMGLISRDSVRQALSNGITAEQIIMYLTAHAHPQMRKNIPLLPPTVVDQIRLWELERNRIKTDEGYLFRDFKSATEFDEVLEYAEELGVVLWKDIAKRLFFVRTASAGSIIEYVKRRANKD